MKSTKLFFILLSIFLSPLVFASNINAANLLAGGTIYGVSNQAPFVLVGNETMDTWQFSNKFSLPKNLNEFVPYAMTCVDKSCFMVGSYTLTSRLDQPLIAVSEDGGYHWDTKNLNFKNEETPTLINIFCDSKQCIAMGLYHEIGNHPFVPQMLLISSDDHFVTWHEVNLPQSDSKKANAGPGTCTDQFCVIATTVPLDPDNNMADVVFFVTNKDKKTWIKATSAPFKKQTMGFGNVNCSQAACVALGSYYDEDHVTRHALIYVSHDQGFTWEQKQLADDHIIPDQVKCKDNYCIAISTSTLINEVKNKVVFVSKDAGNTWQTNTLSIPDETALSLSNLDCTNTYCVIVGRTYSLPNLYDLFIYVTHDQGSTWSRIENINHLPYANVPVSGGLSCNEKNCLLNIGDLYKIYNQISYIPNVVVSDQTGNQWNAINNFVDFPYGNNMPIVTMAYHGSVTASALMLEGEHSGVANKLGRHRRKV